ERAGVGDVTERVAGEHLAAQDYEVSDEPGDDGDGGTGDQGVGDERVGEHVRQGGYRVGCSDRKRLDAHGRAPARAAADAMTRGLRRARSAMTRHRLAARYSAKDTGVTQKPIGHTPENARGSP